MRELKVGDMVKGRRDELYYVVEINTERRTAVVFSPLPGRYHPEIYKWEDLQKIRNES